MIYLLYHKEAFAVAAVRTVAAAARSWTVITGTAVVATTTDMTVGVAGSKGPFPCISYF